MKQPVIIVGLGEMGGVFARALLKAGHPVYPVLRHDNAPQLARQIPEPALVLLAVGEKDLDATVANMPEAWRGKLGLLQNELLPGDWRKHGLADPSVISVWFEKKPGMDFKVLVPSPVYGPATDLIVDALDCLDIPCAKINDQQSMLFELVRKNMYIVTSNICGLETGGTVSELWSDHADLMNRVFDNVLDIQQALTGQSFDRDALLGAVLKAFDGDPAHQCMGRSAPQRLQRALALAAEHGIEVAELQRIDRATKNE